MLFKACYAIYHSSRTSICLKLTMLHFLRTRGDVYGWSRIALQRPFCWAASSLKDSRYASGQHSVDYQYLASPICQTSP